MNVNICKYNTFLKDGTGLKIVGQDTVFRQPENTETVIIYLDNFTLYSRKHHLWLLLRFFIIFFFHFIYFKNT